MKIVDMGEVDLEKANQVAQEIQSLINSDEFKTVVNLENDQNEENAKWVCSACGYTHEGPNPPDKCPVCGLPKEIFIKQ